MFVYSVAVSILGAMAAAILALHWCSELDKRIAALEIAAATARREGDE